MINWGWCANHRLPRAKEATDAPEHFEKNCSTSPNIGTTKNTSSKWRTCDEAQSWCLEWDMVRHGDMRIRSQNHPEVEAASRAIATNPANSWDNCCWRLCDTVDNWMAKTWYSPRLCEQCTGVHIRKTTHSDVNVICDPYYEYSINSSTRTHLDFEFLDSVTNESKVPEYAGFNTRMSREENHSLKPGTSVAYSPLIDIVPSDPSTIMTAMIEARRITKHTGQSITVFTAYQQLYRVAVNVVWVYPELSDDFVLRLGVISLLAQLAL